MNIAYLRKQFRYKNISGKKTERVNKTEQLNKNKVDKLQFVAYHSYKCDDEDSRLFFERQSEPGWWEPVQVGYS